MVNGLCFKGFSGQLDHSMCRTLQVSILPFTQWWRRLPLWVPPANQSWQQFSLGFSALLKDTSTHRRNVMMRSGWESKRLTALTTGFCLVVWRIWAL